MRIRRFNTGFYIRDCQDSDVDSNNNQTEVSSTPLKDLSYTGSSKDRGRKRKRGRPRKLHPEEKQVVMTDRNFTFQNARERFMTHKRPRLSLSVSLSKDLLSDIEMDKTEAIQGSLVSSDHGSNRPVKRVPRTSTPILPSSSESETGSEQMQVQEVSSGKAPNNDSGYEASMVPKVFNVLRFNSDEESD